MPLQKCHHRADECRRDPDDEQNVSHRTGVRRKRRLEDRPIDPGETEERADELTARVRALL